MKFIGIDLGWSSGASGLCCLAWQGQRLTIQGVACLTDLADIWTWLEQMVPPNEPGLVAVDAPTIIPNHTSSRLPDRLSHKYFGRYHAGCYPANLGRPFAARTVGVGKELEARGFDHAPTIEPQRPGRYQIEVFPHPALVHLFSLERIIKYKKGNLASKKEGLVTLQTYLQQHLPRLTPALDLTLPVGEELWQDPQRLTGRELKQLEDQLDSLVCAYIGAHWWYWGQEKNWVLGTEETGYIVVPAPQGQ